jgi:poly-gamma-glutamate capsule biosynthesis protein CapA/YwtB (metallophosphatase superfamily)
MSDAREVTVIATGDVIMNEPEPEKYFAPTRDIFLSTDIPIVHVETPHTGRAQQSVGGIPAPGAPVDRLEVLGDLGVKIATLASNHSYDVGIYGITDTIDELRRLGIAPAGEGVNITQARQPALAQAGGLTLGVLSYNCVGPAESWATAGKPGCAYVRVLTHYEPESRMAGHPAEMFTFADPRSLALFEADIRALREQADVVAVALHKGVGHTRAVVQDYERQVAHAAVEAGADIVISHHAHIMRGIEIYKGVPIYHGLGNFVTVSRTLSLDTPSEERQAWARKRREIFHFEPDPNMPTYAFHPESRNTALAHLVVTKDGVKEAGLIPCWIDDDVRPVPQPRDDGGEKVLDYIKTITREQNLPCEFGWKGDRVVFELS